MSAFILGIWTPLSTISMPASLSTASDRPGNLPSRSRIKNRARIPASLRSMTRFLAAWTTLWGSEIRFDVVTCGQSGSDVVLVGESVEDLLPVDPVLGEVDRFGPLGIDSGRGELAEGTVRPGSVVMP